MALNAIRLGDDILTRLDALNPDAGSIPAGVQTARREAMRAFAAAIVAEITTHARVTVAADVPTGIPVATTGTAAAQTGATTAPSTATTTNGTIQ